MTSRAHNCRLVRQIVGHFANSFTAVKTVFVDAGLSREDSFARLDAGFRTWLLEVISSVEKVLI